MPVQLSATFEVKSWDETPFDDLDTPKLTRAVVSKSYGGDLDGSSTTEWLMAYAEDGAAAFVGLERFTGEIDGRSGTLVLRHVGSYADGTAKADLTVVEGANSGELRSASGEGAFRADPAGSVSLVLSFG
jgi:hypothetical protein